MTDDYIAKLWITRDSPLLVAQINSRNLRQTVT